MIEFVGGPHDGHRVNAISGDRYYFVARSTPKLYISESDPLTMTPILKYVYVGPEHNPDRAHTVYRYKGIET